MEFVTAVILLGIAGLDFSGAMIILTALTLGATRKDVRTFALIDFIGTVAVGVMCSCFLNENIERLTNWTNHIGAILELAVACMLLILVIQRVFSNGKNESNNFLKSALDKGMISVGIAFSIGALMDPSFMALITLAGYNMEFVQIISANCAWILISQSPAFILTIAVMLGKYEKLEAFVQQKLKEHSWFERLKRILPNLLTIIILTAALLLIADGLGALLC